MTALRIIAALLVVNFVRSDVVQVGVTNGFKLSVRDCTSDAQCSGHGTCTEPLGQCTCDGGYAGGRCSLQCRGSTFATNGTVLSVCSGHGTCLQALSGRCRCDDGYLGRDCATVLPVAEAPQGLQAGTSNETAVILSWSEPANTNADSSVFTQGATYVVEGCESALGCDSSESQAALAAGSNAAAAVQHSRLRASSPGDSHTASSNRTNWFVVCETTSSSCAATGLKEGTQYVFEVKAKFRKGRFGSFSQRLTKATAARAPHYEERVPLTNSSVTSNAILVQFVAPRDIGGGSLHARISSYVAQYRRAAMSAWLNVSHTVQDGVPTSANITGLDAFTQYEIRQIAINVAGAGNASAIVTQRTRGVCGNGVVESGSLGNGLSYTEACDSAEHCCDQTSCSLKPASHCSGHGACTAATACSCSAGWTGDRCQYSDATTCSGQGAVNENGECECTAGFSGSDCSQTTSVTRFEEELAVTASTLGLWTFDSHDGGTHDLTEAQRHVTLEGGATASQGDGPLGSAFSHDAALHLPASSAAARTTASSAFNSAAFSIELWIRPASVGSDVTVASYGADSSGKTAWTLRILANGAAEIRSTSSGGTSSALAATSRPLSANEWTHVAATRASDGSAVVYVNGSSAATGTLAQAPASLSSHFVSLGCARQANGNCAADGFVGHIDNARLSNSALAAASVADYFARRKFGADIAKVDYGSLNSGLTISFAEISTTTECNDMSSYFASHGVFVAPTLRDVRTGSASDSKAGSTASCSACNNAVSFDVYFETPVSAFGLRSAGYGDGHTLVFFDDANQPLGTVVVPPGTNSKLSSAGRSGSAAIRRVRVIPTDTSYYGGTVGFCIDDMKVEFAAGSSCAQLRNKHNATDLAALPTGIYNVAGGATLCDMSSDGGGWTLMGSVFGGDANRWTGAPGSSGDLWSNSDLTGAATNPIAADFKSRAWVDMPIAPGATELLFTRSFEGIERGRARLAHTCAVPDSRTRFTQLWSDAAAMSQRANGCPATSITRITSHLDSCDGTAYCETSNDWIGGSSTEGVCYIGGDTDSNIFAGRFVWNQKGYGTGTCFETGHLGGVGVYSTSHSQYTVADITGTNWMYNMQHSKIGVSFYMRPHESNTTCAAVSAHLRATNASAVPQDAVIDADGSGSVHEARKTTCGLASGRTCRTILVANPRAPDGVYTVDLPGIGSFEAYCDMANGGWTMLAHTESGYTSGEAALVRGPSGGTYSMYTDTGYGHPAARTSWIPLRAWTNLTSTFPHNRMRFASSADEVVVTNASFGSPADYFKFSFAERSHSHFDHFKDRGFTTHDADHDTSSSNCASTNTGYNGGWWYEACQQTSMLHNNGKLFSFSSNAGTEVSWLRVWFLEISGSGESCAAIKAANAAAQPGLYAIDADGAGSTHTTGVAYCGFLSGADCASIKRAHPFAPSGLYTITAGGASFETECDMDRGRTLLAFSQAGFSSGENALVVGPGSSGTFNAYSVTGFGHPTANVMWMPLTLWHAMTSAGTSNRMFVQHSTSSYDITFTQVAISDASSEHSIDWSAVSSSYWNELKGMRFTTWDNDNDQWSSNCAKDNSGYNGGFWYNACKQTSLIHRTGNLYAWNGNTDNTVTSIRIWLETIPAAPSGSCSGVAEGPRPVRAMYTLDPDGSGGDYRSNALLCGLRRGKTCREILKRTPNAPDGVYTLQIGSVIVESYCDMTNGGWTLLAKSEEGYTAKEKLLVVGSGSGSDGTYTSYTETGYGSAAGATFWVPLAYWHELTSAYPSNEMIADAPSKAVTVTNLAIGDAAAGFTINWASSTNSYLNPIRGTRFTTWDRDQDTWSGNCARTNVGYNGAFWYTNCYQNSMLHSDGKIYSWQGNGGSSGNDVAYLHLKFREA